MSRRRRGRHQRDFWRAWREEMRRQYREEHPGEDETSDDGGQDDGQDDIKFEFKWRGGGPPPWAKPPIGPPPPEVIHAWREFFHEHMGSWPEKHWAFGGRRFNPWHQGMATFNPFVASLLSKGGGLLPLLVLHLVGQKPRYGNEVMTEIAEKTQGQWVPNPGAIYPLMTELEDQGLIRGEWEDPDKRTVKIYHLTESGEQELARMKAIIRPKILEAVEVMRQMVADFNTGEEDFV